MSERTASAAARIFAAFLVARAAAGLVYLGVSLGGWPVPWYMPLEHRWVIGKPALGLAMGWFGATAAAVVAAVVFGWLTWIVSARGALSRALARTAIVLAIARAGGLVLLVDFAYFGWTLTHQTPRPLPECPKGP
ncbi:Hypothetical protein A7982_10925 [Minicystis rosea]|nr:Hypothetical protein A7982_10925 [Minicystis rosea]